MKLYLSKKFNLDLSMLNTDLKAKLQNPFKLMKISSKTLSMLLNIALVICVFIL